MNIMRRTTPFMAVLLLALAGIVTAPAQAQEPRLEELEQMQVFLGLMNQFFEIIDSMYEVSDNPEKAAIFQMHKIQEVYEEGGDKFRAAAVMREVLDESSNSTIRAATYLMLGDLLKENGRRDEAIEVLRRGLDESLRNAR